jgi:F-type H+-transporting ATPase subunit b
VLIDWFTVGAQLLNFIILVWLMKRFLYQPVLDAIAAREQMIAKELADAAATKTRADQQQDEFQKKNQDFDAQREALLRQAKDAAKAEREHLQAEAREALDAANAKRATAQVAELQHLYTDITRDTQQQVFDIARRVLGELADVSLEQRASEVFIQRLQALEPPVLATLSTALKAATEAEPALVHSAFTLPDTQRATIQEALDTAVGQSVTLNFETKPELVSGIELSVQGQKLAWSISQYLGGLLSGLEDRLAVAQTP